MLTLLKPCGFSWTMRQNPRKAESFSSLSLISQRAVHHACANVAKFGATLPGHTSPIRPMVTAAFSDSDLGDLVLRRMGMSRSMSACTNGSNGDGSLAYCSAISPTAQAALLHTLMHSGFGSGTICSMTAGMICGMAGFRRAKHEMAMSPRRAWADWRTGGSECWTHQQSPRRNSSNTHGKTDRHEVEKGGRGAGDELTDLISDTLSEARQQVEGNDDERPVRLVVLVGVLVEDLVCLQRRVDDVDASLVDRGSVWSERRTGSDRNG